MNKLPYIFFICLISNLSMTKPQVDDILRIKLDDKTFIDFVWIDSLEIWAGKYEITNQQYRKFMRFRDGNSISGLNLNGDSQPAVFVSYCDAIGFCFWVNNNAELPNEFKARLPNKKEWDYLITAGKQSKYAWGNKWPPKFGNFLDQTGKQELGWEWQIANYDDGFAVSAPVESTSINALGVCGIAGNVREWTSEITKDGSWHMIRGASWRDSNQEKLRWNYGIPGAMWGKDNHIGFRIVLSQNSTGN